MPPTTTSAASLGCSGHSKGQKTIQDEVNSAIAPFRRAAWATMW
jgi:hypothetical protein